MASLFLLAILFSSCSSTNQKSSPTQSNPLLQQYKMMRQKKWSNYTQQRSKKHQSNKRSQIKQTSVSVEHLKKNPIYQQVTQIHCYKIRASESKCAAIKYLAYVNCGNITKESQIKRYSNCLDQHFKK